MKVQRFKQQFIRILVTFVGRDINRIYKSSKIFLNFLIDGSIQGVL